VSTTTNHVSDATRARK